MGPYTSLIPLETLSEVLETSVSRVEGALISRVHKNVLVFISSLEEDSEAAVVMVAVSVPPMTHTESDLAPSDSEDKYSTATVVHEKVLMPVLISSVWETLKIGDSPQNFGRQLFSLVPIKHRMLNILTNLFTWNS